MEPLSTLIATSVLGEVFKTIGKKATEAGVSAARVKVNNIAKAFKKSHLIEDYLEKAVYKVFVFRTITKGNVDVYLDEIYHPIKIKPDDRDENIRIKAITVGDNCYIERKGCVAIVGLAGQGKTTIMRKLFLEELVRKERIPFFLTLRQFDYSTKVGCEGILLEHMNANGIDCELDDVIDVLKTGKVVFYWDGFDEIKSSERENALAMINSIYDKYSCSSLVTTRPDTEITRQAGVFLYRVEKLSRQDVILMIEKIVSDQITSNSIIELLKKRRFLSETIRTPILIDILIVTSLSLNDEPNSIRDYYDHLFTALMYRHDLSKNYKREKKSSLGNSDLEELFGFFSFFSFMESKSDFTLELMHSLFAKSCKAKQIDASEEFVCCDIIDGTNLITQDGYNNYVYIHRSIQEYFSAKCVSQFNDKQKNKLFNVYVKSDIDGGNSNFLSLARFVDPIGFYKHYMLPFLSLHRILIDGELVPLDKECISEVIDEWMVGTTIDDNTKGIGDIQSFTMLKNGRSEFYNRIIQLNELCKLLGIKNYGAFIGKLARYLHIECRNITHAYFSNGGENKVSILDGENRKIHSGMYWAALGDYKHLIPDYDEKIVDVYYGYYISSLEEIREIIDNEYTKKIKSKMVVSTMLEDMGF
ncbi:NACHT domain-containing protein [Serratia marcescens]|uniref:NACHT domain-containing protein n=1 Tax=Serratia marcescens TaxID=615 RepID=UPI003F852FBD